MKRKLVITGIVLLYVISCFGSYYMIKWNYENLWKSSNPGLSELIIVFAPVVNTLFCFWWYIDYSGFFDMDFNKFFGIDKRE